MSLPLHTKVLVGLVAGAALGALANTAGRDAPWVAWVVANVAGPAGQIFLRTLFMVVVPLVFTSVVLGVASLGDLRRIGRVGAKTLVFFVATTSLAVVLGLAIVNVVRPGAGLDPAVRARILADFAAQAGEKVEAAAGARFGVDTLVAVVPRNPVAAAASGDMLGILFFSLVFGIALALVPPERRRPVVAVLEGVGDAVMLMIGFAMKLAPVGVAALLFGTVARFGFGLLEALGLYVVTVLGALLVHQFVVLGALARLLVGIGPRSFFGRCQALMVTAFSTSSSNATLPTTIRTAEEAFGVPPEIAGFVLPLGATMNMNGTALFEGLTVVFLAQVFGVHLTLGTQLVVVVMSVITAIGVAGVPSGSIPLIVMVLGMVGVPPEGIGLVLGVDRLLDMTRTMPNVTGDLLASLWVARSEGLLVGARPEGRPGGREAPGEVG